VQTRKQEEQPSSHSSLLAPANVFRRAVFSVNLPALGSAHARSLRNAFPRALPLALLGESLIGTSTGYMEVGTESEDASGFLDLPEQRHGHVGSMRPQHRHRTAVKTCLLLAEKVIQPSPLRMIPVGPSCHLR